MPDLPAFVGGEAKPILGARLVDVPERLPGAQRVCREGRHAHLLRVTTRVTLRLKSLKMSAS